MWKMCALDKSTLVAFYSEVNPISPGLNAGPATKQFLLQFVTQYHLSD